MGRKNNYRLDQKLCQWTYAHTKIVLKQTKNISTCLWCWSLGHQGASSWPLWLEATRGQQPPNNKVIITTVTYWYYASFILYIPYSLTYTLQGSSTMVFKVQNCNGANGFQYDRTNGWTAPSQPHDQAAHDSWDEAVNSLLSGFCLWEACCTQASYNQYVVILKTLK